MPFDFQGFRRTLLRLEQCAGVIRVGKALHQVTHDNRQLFGDLRQQQRIALLRGDSLRERQNNPAARDAAAAVAELHRVVVHRQNHRRDVRRVGIAVFRVDGDRITAGDGLDTRPVTAPLLLVGQEYQREADGAMHTARVISWNGVATYGAMAAGAPLGVYLNQQWGLAGVAALIVLAVAVALLLASGKPDVSIAAGQRIAFSAVFGRIWAYGLGLAMGTVGFGVIATFITLYYADKGWSGAAFSLTLFSCAFVGIRLIFSNVINRHGGLKVTLASFLVEIVGLLLIWQAGEPWMVQTGALLAGAGFSLVFPALGVEAVKQVPPQNQGTALGTYSAFLDLALGITGPLAGLLIGQTGVPSIYLAAALLVALGVLLTLRLLQRSRA